MKKLLWALSAVLLAGCAAPEYRSPAFKDVDIDGDGIVTWEEYQFYFPSRKRAAFVATDEDEDETLDEGEFDAGIGVEF